MNKDRREALDALHKSLEQMRTQLLQAHETLTQLDDIFSSLYSAARDLSEATP